MAPSVSSLLWGLIFILEANSSLEYLLPGPTPAVAHQEGSRTQNIQMSQPCVRHTLSTRVIQTSLCTAINEFFFLRVHSGFPEHSTKHPSPPWATLQHDLENSCDIMKPTRTQGLLPSFLIINTPATLGACTVHVTTLATVPTRSEVLVPTDLATTMPVFSMTLNRV